jgi:cytochrome bd-type quinol oxidase subunit 1
MNFPLILIFAIYGLLFLVAIVLLAYFIFKRVKARKTENFEKRDN